MSALITPEILLKMRPELPPETAVIVATKLEAALRKFGIIEDEGAVSRNRVAHVLAQLAVESNFLPQRENLNYSAKRLMEVWPSRFTQALAEKCAGNPEMIANIVYADRMGNKAPGEGFRFRGGGLLQHTGRDAYEGIGGMIGFDLVNHPQLLLEIGVSCLAAAAYFKAHTWKGLRFIQLVDSTATGWEEQVRNVTYFVNGGQNGVDERKYAYKQACLLLGVELRVIAPLPSPLTPENIPPLPLPRRPQFYYPVAMGDGDDDFNNDVGGWLDPLYYADVGSEHPGADLNQNRKKPGQTADRELGHPYGVIYDGLVVEVSEHKVWGWTTVIKHFEDPKEGGPFWSQYAHSDRVLVKVGDRVVGGQQIGTIGKGAKSDKYPRGRYFAHLHFEVRNFNEQQLPADFWPSTKYPNRQQAQACIRRNYRDPIKFLQNRDAINPVF